MDFRTLIPVLGILLVLIPVAGLTLGLTLRLAVKPFVETLANAIHNSSDPRSSDRLVGQIDMLQDDLSALTEEVRELRRAQEFDQKLLHAHAESVLPQS